MFLKQQQNNNKIKLPWGTTGSYVGGIKKMSQIFLTLSWAVEEGWASDNRDHKATGGIMRICSHVIPSTLQFGGAANFATASGFFPPSRMKYITFSLIPSGRLCLFIGCLVPTTEHLMGRNWKGSSLDCCPQTEAKRFGPSHTEQCVPKPLKWQTKGSRKLGPWLGVWGSTYNHSPIYIFYWTTKLHCDCYGRGRCSQRGTIGKKA